MSQAHNNPAQCLKRATYLFLDFDGTLTVKDTMSTLGALSKGSQTTWQAIAKAYQDDVDAAPPFQWKDYNRSEYSRWLAERKTIEVRSARRVQDALFFKGAKSYDMDRIITDAFRDGTLQLRPGWDEVLELFCRPDTTRCSPESQSEIAIVSVNWSETFIRRVLRLGVETSRTLDHEALRSLIDRMEIHSNEIQGLNEPNGSNGVVCREPADLDLRTSDDKLRCMKRMLSRLRDGASAEQTPLTVYVGDSSTDFDCLCEVALGLWIYDGSEQESTENAKRVFAPLRYEPLHASKRSEPGNKDQLFYWMPDLFALKDILTDQSEI